MSIYDIIIIGAGPAGLSAGIYAARRNLKTLIIGQEIGGQMGKTYTIENYPGIKTIGALELSLTMAEHAKESGAEIITGEIDNLKKENNLFLVQEKESGTFYQAEILILAFGLKKRKLGLAEEQRYEGHGISYCVTCDGPLFKNKPVAVVGGGNSGAEAVEFLAKICPEVYWLELLPEIKADSILIEKIKNLTNVKIFTKTKITAIQGEEKISNIIIDCDGQKETLDVQGIFVEIGYTADTDWLKDLLDLDNLGQIKINELGHTNMPGIFAAGDVTNSKYKQIVVATGSGAIAALEAYEYLRAQN